MQLDWRTHHVRELVVAPVHYSASRSGVAGPAGQVLAVVLAFAAVVVAGIAVEQPAFVGQTLALPRQWV